MPELRVNPIAPDRARIETFRFRANNHVPNNPRLPVVLIRGALDGAQPDREIHALYRVNLWGGICTWTIYDFHHFHSNAHEALAVASGEARLTIGGAEGEAVTIRAGDLVVLPAGTGHRLIESSEDFAVCGAYPKGQDAPDLLEATAENCSGVAERIAAVPLPRTDPFYGTTGPLLALWSG